MRSAYVKQKKNACVVPLMRYSSSRRRMMLAGKFCSVVCVQLARNIVSDEVFSAIIIILLHVQKWAFERNVFDVCGRNCYGVCKQLPLGALSLLLLYYGVAFDLR